MKITPTMKKTTNVKKKKRKKKVKPKKNKKIVPLSGISTTDLNRDV
jgi:hypothetical protein